MAQIVIDGVLFSPVLAHSLEPGDLFCYRLPDYDPRAGELAAPVRVVAPIEHRGRFVDVSTPPVSIGTHRVTTFDRNYPVLRAVGARVGRGGAR